MLSSSVGRWLFWKGGRAGRCRSLEWCGGLLGRLSVVRGLAFGGWWLRGRGERAEGCRGCCLILVDSIRECGAGVRCFAVIF